MTSVDWLLQNFNLAVVTKYSKAPRPFATSSHAEVSGNIKLQYSELVKLIWVH